MRRIFSWARQADPGVILRVPGIAMGELLHSVFGDAVPRSVTSFLPGLSGSTRSRSPNLTPAFASPDSASARFNEAALP